MGEVDDFNLNELVSFMLGCQVLGDEIPVGFGMRVIRLTVWSFHKLRKKFRTLGNRQKAANDNVANENHADPDAEHKNESGS